MRRSGVDAAGRPRRASDEEWTGALLHELAHALGFSGHVAAGPSFLVRDQSLLRDLGRAALRGETLADPTLKALYRVRPGQRLGHRELQAASASWVEAILALDRRYEALGNRRVALVASTGDREARLSFRYADGARLGLRFPGWAEALRHGGPLLAWPDRAGFEAIRELSP
jgi:hypothetical protein